MRPEKGKHIVTVVDGSGSEAVVKFEIVNSVCKNTPITALYSS